MNGSGVLTPALGSEQKIQEISAHMRRIIELLGLDLGDPNLAETPERVAKMYIEMFQGLSEGARPKITVFPNDEHYTAMVMEKEIPF
jgi:GTP cyclohydrolase I